MEFFIEKPVAHPVHYLRADCEVRYWEDATVDGVDDEDGSRIPLRLGDSWMPTIELATGIVCDWPPGVTATTHYKVCDAGTYALLDADKNVVVEFNSYVPTMMSPGGTGYGDYVIMSIGPDGRIADWKVDLTEFSPLTEGAR